MFNVLNGARPLRPAEGFSERLWTAVTECWLKDPDDRPTIQEFMDEFSTAKSYDEVHANKHSAPEGNQEYSQSRGRQLQKFSDGTEESGLYQINQEQKDTEDTDWEISILSSLFVPHLTKEGTHPMWGGGHAVCTFIYLLLLDVLQCV